MSMPEIEPCSGCGQCCATIDRPPFLRDDPDHPDFARWQAVPPYMKAEIQCDERPYGSPCLWWDADSKRCIHYHLRPEVCRTFQPGEPACNTFRGRISLPMLPEVEESQPEWVKTDEGQQLLADAEKCLKEKLAATRKREMRSTLIAFALAALWVAVVLAIKLFCDR